MDFGHIPKKLLDLVLGETYDGPYTMRDELTSVDEDIIHYQADCQQHPQEPKGCMFLACFRAWTKSYAVIMVDNPFGDRQLLAIHRNPPVKGKKARKK